MTLRSQIGSYSSYLNRNPIKAITLKAIYTIKEKNEVFMYNIFWEGSYFCHKHIVYEY